MNLHAAMLAEPNHSHLLGVRADNVSDDASKYEMWLCVIFTLTFTPDCYRKSTY